MFLASLLYFVQIEAFYWVASDYVGRWVFLLFKSRWPWRMGKTKEKEGKSKQFRWSIPMDRVFLEILADEANKGNKPSNTFKHSSFVRVAQSITDKFGAECTTDHVENHLRTVKNVWTIISAIRDKSGFGWDNNLHMITCDKKNYDAEVTAHPTHEKYLNKKIDMYEEMAIVVGKDIATGSFAKSFADIDVQEAEVDSTPINDEVDFEEIAKGKQASSSAPSSQPRSHRKRGRDNEESGYEKVAGQLGEVALAIKQLSQDQLVITDLYTEIMKTEGFDEIFLASVFDYLVENEKQAKAFMVKNPTLRRVWIENFMTQQWAGR